MHLNKITPLAQLVANEMAFSLANDTLALALLDSMLNGSSIDVRKFYFWVVTKTLSYSDGYYSEGVGYCGTEFLMDRPEEFIRCWQYCINFEERREWAYYLAAEEHISSEGYPIEFVMNDYRTRLDTIFQVLPSTYRQAKNILYQQVDSIYRILARDDRPMGPWTDL